MLLLPGFGVGKEVVTRVTRNLGEASRKILPMASSRTIGHPILGDMIPMLVGIFPTLGMGVTGVTLMTRDLALPPQKIGTMATLALPDIESLGRFPMLSRILPIGDVGIQGVALMARNL